MESFNSNPETEKEKEVMVFAGSSHTVALLRFSCFGRPRRARGPVASDWDSRPGSWPVPPPPAPSPLFLVCGEQPGAHRPVRLVLWPLRAGDLQVHHTERVQAGRARPSHRDGVCQAVTRKPVLLTSGRAGAAGRRVSSGVCCFRWRSRSLPCLFSHFLLLLDSR